MSDRRIFRNVKIPTENLTDDNLAIYDTYGNDLRCGDMEVDKVADIVVKILNEDFTDVTLANGDTYGDLLELVMRVAEHRG